MDTKKLSGPILCVVRALGMQTAVKYRSPFPPWFSSPGVDSDLQFHQSKTDKKDMHICQTPGISQTREALWRFTIMLQIYTSREFDLIKRNSCRKIKELGQGHRADEWWDRWRVKPTSIQGSQRDSSKPRATLPSPFLQRFIHLNDHWINVYLLNASYVLRSTLGAAFELDAVNFWAVKGVHVTSF